MPGIPDGALHVTNGDAVVPELADAAGIDPAEVLVWREILHDGPVPAGLDPDELARVRARHLAARDWTPAEPPPPDGTALTEDATLAMMRERDRRLAAHPPDAEVILWFEDDLFDALLLAQIEDRLAARGNGTGAGPVTRVRLRHPPRGDLAAALAAREPVDPDPAAFAALRSPDPRAWTAVPAFARLLEELPDSRTGLSRLERQILEALADGPLTPHELFTAAVASEDPPWVGDATVFALADDLDPLVAFDGDRYELTPERRRRPRGNRHPPTARPLARRRPPRPGRPDWVWDATGPPPRPARQEVSTQGGASSQSRSPREGPTCDRLSSSSGNVILRTRTVRSLGGPGLEPELPGPKPSVLPITLPPSKSAHACGQKTASGRGAEPILRCPRV